MAEHMVLLGAEDVQRSARTIADAAGQMERAAEAIAQAMKEHVRDLTELLRPVEPEPEPEPDAPAPPAPCSAPPPEGATP